MARLVDLEPAWITTTASERRGMGVSFLCPVHGATGGPSGSACYLGVWFENPVDGGLPYKPGDSYRPRPNESRGPEPLWHRTGETFDDLTLTPSIDAKDHWHGFITGGQVH